MEFIELAQERYSCRKFDTKMPSDEQIQTILKSAQLAPTAVDKQPFHIWVLKSEEAVKKASECTRFHFNAPLIFVLGSKEDKAWVRKFDNKNFADVDTTIVGTHMMLEIQDLGLGTTWVGHFDAPALKEAFPVMKDYELLALFPTGYPASDAEKAPMHFKRLDLEELVDTL